MDGGRGAADFYRGSRRAAFENRKKRRGKEIIERPRASIDANKAFGRTGRADALARTLSEEMRQVISLLDLDSFLRPRVFRLPLALPYLDSPSAAAAAAATAAGEKYTGSRGVAPVS